MQSVALVMAVSFAANKEKYTNGLMPTNKLR